jgi:polyisoprenoid-binding protein YceI
MNRRLAPAVALIAAVFSFPATGSAQAAAEAQTVPGSGVETWEIDESHSRIGFSVRHFFTPVEGSFSEYDIELAFDPAAPETGHVSVTIDAASVTTGNQRRDDDLRGEQFFEVATYPTLAFESSTFRRVSADEFVAAGDLTIRDVTKPVELTVKLLGIKELEGDLERFGRAVAGLEAAVTIDRREFDIGTGRWAETVIMGPDVEISILLEAKLR